jgi:hypothetical protein
MKLDPLKIFTDRNLLGQFLKDPSTWEGWLAFVCAVFGRKPVSRKRKEIFKQCAGGRKWPEREVAEAWVISGRRSGKSTVVALISAFLAAFREYPNLTAGEVGHVLIVSVTKAQSNIIKRYLSGIFNENPFLKSLVVRETQTEIELSNGIIITVMTSDFRSLRGYTAIAVIIDEIAFFQSEGSRPCHEAIRALRPSLATTGGPLIAISSPYSKRGSLYNAWKQHYGKDGDVLIWQSDSRTMNPCLSEAMIERQMSEDRAGSLAEWMGEFRSDISGFLPPEWIERTIIQRRYELPPQSNTTYRAFCDVSGGAKDAYTLSIAHEEQREGGPVIVQDVLKIRRAPHDPHEVTKEYAGILREYSCGEVCGDRYSAGWVINAYGVHGIRYKHAELTASEIYLFTESSFARGALELLDNSILVHELKNLERRTRQGGRDQVTHGSPHDDAANATCGSLWLLSQKKQGPLLAGWLGSDLTFEPVAYSEHENDQQDQPEATGQQPRRPRQPRRIRFEV